MESIAAFDAKTRLSELLERAANGETFESTKHGRPVGKLGPPDSARDPRVVAEAVQRGSAARVGERVQYRDGDVGAVVHRAVHEVGADEPGSAGD